MADVIKPLTQLSAEEVTKDELVQIGVFNLVTQRQHYTHPEGWLSVISLGRSLKETLSGLSYDLALEAAEEAVRSVERSETPPVFTRIPAKRLRRDS